MCTAISYTGNRHYFGRNLDVDAHYEEQDTKNQELMEQQEVQENE